MTSQPDATLVIERLPSTIAGADWFDWPMDVQGQWTEPLDRTDEREAPPAVVDDGWGGTVLIAGQAWVELWL